MARVKICGIKSLLEAQLAVEAGADAVGFILTPGAAGINPELAREICLSLPPFITKVGVFVNEQRYVVEELATFCKLDVLQFDGLETPEYCKRWSYQVIKSFKVTEGWDVAELGKYQAEGFLLEAQLSEVIDNGSFEYTTLIKAKEFGRPLILKGGLNPSNVMAAVQCLRPFAVEASTGIEVNGVKSCDLMRSFITQAK